MVMSSGLRCDGVGTGCTVCFASMFTSASASAIVPASPEANAVYSALGMPFAGLVFNLNNYFSSKR